MKNTETGIQKIDYGLVLRLVIGWTYFSALWRRLIISYKMDPDLPNYLGIKFNHFLPNSILIKDVIEFFVSHPELLWWKLLLFTLAEGVFGLLLMLGLFTRFSAIVTMSLAFGILLGAGWLGTTCLDEWQIGILGMAGGFSILLMGPGKYSLDALFKDKSFYKKLCFFKIPSNNKLVLTGSLVIFFISLATNQIFHGGLWGPLHNKSVSPIVEISHFNKVNKALSFDVQRVEGPDVYGSFVYGLKLLDDKENVIYERYGKNVHSHIESIENSYIAQVQKSKYALKLPLGAKARLLFKNKEVDFEKIHKITLVDINGKEWSAVLSSKEKT